MQHRYVADLGDYGKYGLLSTLLTPRRSQRLRLGVLWCLTHPQGAERSRNDGRHTAYLRNSINRALAECNPELHTKLQQVHTTKRHISSIEEGGILPSDTIFWSKDINSTPLPPLYRALYRKAYLLQAALAFRETALVFVDPDNGITDKTSTTSGKAISISELSLIWSLGKSLLVYQHRPRIAEAALRDRYTRFKRILKASQLTVFRFHKGNQRDFLLFTQDNHQRSLAPGVAGFQRSLWVERGFFDVFTV